LDRHPKAYTKPFTLRIAQRIFGLSFVALFERHPFAYTAINGVLARLIRRHRRDSGGLAVMIGTMNGANRSAIQLTASRCSVRRVPR
jgi:hypothetical protein